MSETIIERSSKDMYIENMVQYCIHVDRVRAFPEIRDSLKPVQRRLIYSMFNMAAYKKNVKKCAMVTGETIGKYSPHGPAAVYTAMIVLSNWWKTKMPLIDIHGNSGTVMGDGPAAERYTEASLSDFCYDCIVSELKESEYIVDWKPNYTRTLSEPEYFPVKVPLLLINGAFGIGVGLSTNIPSHNLNEVIDVTRLLLKDPNADFTLIPDHCQPLTIFNTNWKEINETGFGSYKVRGIINTYEGNKGKEKGFPVLNILSLPDNISTADVCEKLYALIEKKQLPMIKDIVDESALSVNIKVILKKGSDTNYVKEVLYSKCGVQGTVSVNFEAVDDINPKRLSYREYLLKFIDFRATTKLRLYCNKYKDASTRCHKLETYIKAIESGEIDNIIKMVKKQTTIDDTVLQEYLISKLKITDLQAQFILGTDIRKLSRGYLEKYKAEYKSLNILREQYKSIIMDEKGTVIMKEIDQELEEIKNKYGSPRICEIVSSDQSNNIPKGTFKIIITEKNFIRKIPDTDKVNAVRGDNPKYVIRVENTESLLLFDNKGKCFKLPVHKVPVTDKSSIGTDIRIIVKNLTADIISIIYEPVIHQLVNNKKYKHNIIVVSKYNIIKKLDLDDFVNVNPSGMIYTKLKDTDEVAGITICPSNMDVVVSSQQKALRMHASDIPVLKRAASGCKCMNTNSYIEGLSIIYPNTKYIIVLTEKGKINKFPIDMLSAHSRGTSGQNVIKLDNGDAIYGIYGAVDTDVLKVTTTDGIKEILVGDIKAKSGVAAGERLIKSNIVRCDLIYNQQ